MSLRFVYGFLFMMLARALSPLPPVWKTSPYLRAGSYDLITTPTTYDVTPMVTMPFSSAFSAVPNVGYGMIRYKGRDSLNTEEVQINMTSITTSSFSVLIQIRIGTFIYLLSVSYVAIDVDFPHHLNSFDNVNFTLAPVLNTVIETYTNPFNYTQQALAIGSRYTNFTPPFSNTKIMLLLTTFSTRSTSPTSPVTFDLQWQIVSNETYQITVKFGVLNYVELLRFSVLVFDVDDINRSGRYEVVSSEFTLNTSEALLWLPAEFMDNFIIGLTNFSSDRAQSNICFDWDSTSIAGVFHMRKKDADCLTVIDSWYTLVNSYSFTYFYLKTWECPTNSLFDSEANVCYGCAVSNCRLCPVEECQECSPGFCYDAQDRKCYYCSMSIQKQDCNSFVVKLGLGDVVTSSEQISLSSSKATISSVSSDGSHVYVTCEYTQQLVGEILHFNIGRTVLQFNCSRIMTPLVMYTQQQCLQEQQLGSLLKAVQILSLLVLLLGLGSNKIVGLELVGLLQLGYFSLAPQQFVSIYLRGLVSTRLFNGLNIAWLEEPQMTWPGHYQQLGISHYFANNCNVMLLITALVMFVGAGVYLVLAFLQKLQWSARAGRVLKQISLTMAIFNTHNIAFSAATHFASAQPLPGYVLQYWLSVFLVVAGFCFLFANVFVLEFSSRCDYREYKLSFKPNTASHIYISVSLVYRVCLGIYIALLWDPNYHSVLPVYISFAFLMYCLINLPFKSWAQNYRAGAVRVAELVTLLNINYFRSMKKHESLAAKARLHQPVLAQVALLLLCLLLSAAVLGWELWCQARKCWRNRTGNEITQEVQAKSKQNGMRKETEISSLRQIKG